jgi:cytidylate kinase
MMRVVAIDGPAASGKSSTARAVARAIGFHHLDSGALYRSLTRVALDAGLDPGHLDVAALLAAAERRGLGLRPEGEDFIPLLDGVPAEGLIRTPEVTAAVSAVSAVPAVRDWANARMRALAEAGVPVVVDGRDIGSVVFPEAELKIYLYATSLVRALRRLAQQGGPEASNEEILAEAERLKARDKADSSRPVAPLVSPEDAVEIDTSRMTFEEQVDGIARLARVVYRLPEP